MMCCGLPIASYQEYLVSGCSTLSDNETNMWVQVMSVAPFIIQFPNNFLLKCPRSHWWPLPILFKYRIQKKWLLQILSFYLRMLAEIPLCRRTFSQQLFGCPESHLVSERKDEHLIIAFYLPIFRIIRQCIRNFQW